jgi:hypothetical protein
MAQKPIEQLVNRLKAHCDKGRGRRVEVAKLFGVHPQTVSKWFAHKGEPTGSQALAIQAYLKRRQPPHENEESCT